ncbi:MAG: GAF domain-containing protein, partial [Chloroflexota bacterium]
HSITTGHSVLVSDLDNDPDWQDTPLLKNIAAKGFISLPISSNGHVDAAILATSHTPLSFLTKEDEQIFELIANQVAIALENLNLLTETRRRLREVNLLLDFSHALDSLDPTEILETLVASALKVMSHAHAGVVMLWNEDQGELVPHASSGYTNDDVIKEITYRSGEALPGQVFADGNELRIDELDFAKQYNLSSSKLMAYRGATGGRLPVSTMALPIQTGETILGVIVLDNFNSPAAFTLEDQALVSSLAQQTALTLENARLFQASTQRAGQLQALTDAATSISSSLEFDSLISSLLGNLTGIIPFETASLWLRNGERLTLQAELGVTESEERLGLTVRMSDSPLLSGMISTGEPITIKNVHEDQRFPTQTNHLYSSWLGMPLISKGQVIGVIALEKEQEDFYTIDHIQAMKTFAGQAAAALENARLYEDSVSRAHELDQRSQRLAQLNRISNQISASLDPDHLLNFAAEELYNAMSCSAVTTILYEEDGLVLLKNDIPKLISTLPIVLSNAPIFNRLRQTQGAYSVENILSEPEFAPLKDFFVARNTVSVLAIPLATSTETHGVFLIHSDTSRVFSSDEIELGLTISNQAAVGVENARLYEASRKFTEELEQRVAERTVDLAREHQTTRTLLRISTELSSSLDLEQVLTRSLELLNETTGANQSSILLIRAGDANLVYRAGVGEKDAPPEGGQSSDLKIGESMAAWVIDNQKPLVIPNLLADPRWTTSPENRNSAHRSAIAAPLIVGEEALGVLMLFHDKENHFSDNQVSVVQAAANQFAVGINNSELYLLIRDQAESLGSMLRSQQVQSSRSTAMLEGVADGVLVTDAEGNITLFNTAAQDILDMQSDQIVGKSLEEFVGLFGGAAQAWMETIRSWSQNTPTDEAGHVYSEQIMLEDGSVVSVRLAPVSSREEFLGTVSIFRDVTHQVEVDRLKSEFVATVSHELRTPMTPIKGYIDLLLLGGAGELNEQQAKFMQVINTNINRLSGLVNDLLDVSKIESGEEVLSFEQVHLQDTIREVVEEAQSLSSEDGKALAIEFKMQPNVPDVNANPDRIKQIISNLIDNAYNYTQENGHIEVRLLTSNNMVQVDVSDTGMGIFPQDQDRVFDRFYRGENPMVMAVPGTGLGL